MHFIWNFTAIYYFKIIELHELDCLIDISMRLNLNWRNMSDMTRVTRASCLSAQLFHNLYKIIYRIGLRHVSLYKEPWDALISLDTPSTVICCRNEPRPSSRDSVQRCLCKQCCGPYHRQLWWGTFLVSGLALKVFMLQWNASMVAYPQHWPQLNCQYTYWASPCSIILLCYYCFV